MKKICVVCVVYLLWILGFIYLSSCECLCGKKFYQVTYNDGKVEYYKSGDLKNQSDGFVVLTIRDSADNKISERFVPQSSIKAVDEIEGDIPTDTKPVVKHDSVSLPSNIKMK